MSFSFSFYIEDGFALISCFWGVIKAINATANQYNQGSNYTGKPNFFIFNPQYSFVFSVNINIEEMIKGDWKMCEAIEKKCGYGLALDFEKFAIIL